MLFWWGTLQNNWGENPESYCSAKLVVPSWILSGICNALPHEIIHLCYHFYTKISTYVLVPESESEAWEYAKKTGLDVVAICPTLILGWILQSTVNASAKALIKILKDGCNSLENRLRLIVDARDVVEEQVLAYEMPEAKGRYICMAHAIKVKDLVEKFRSTYPNNNYPKRWVLR